MLAGLSRVSFVPLWCDPLLRYGIVTWSSVGRAGCCWWYVYTPVYMARSGIHLDRLHSGLSSDDLATFLAYESSDMAPVVQGMDVDIDPNLSVYSAASDSSFEIDVSALQEQRMEDDQHYSDTFAKEYPTLKVGEMLSENAATAPLETSRLAAQLKTVLDNPSTLTENVDRFLNDFIPQPRSSDLGKNYSRSPDKVLAEAIGRPEEGKERRISTIVNYRTPETSNSEGVDKDQHGLPVFDYYGRPVVGTQIFVSDQSTGKTSPCVLIRPLPTQFRGLRKVEDLFLGEGQAGEYHPMGPRHVASVKSGMATSHDSFLTNLKVQLAGLRLDKTKDYRVFVRFDVGHSAGKSGVDCFAPHLYFELTGGEVYGVAKRPPGSADGPGAKKPKQEPKKKNSRKRDDGQDGQPALKKGKTVLVIQALNGSSEISTRNVLESFEDDAEASESKVGIETADEYAHVLMGKKAKPQSARMAESIVENTFNASRPVKYVYLEKTNESGLFDFGGADVPSSVEEIMDIDSITFANGLAQDLTERNPRYQPRPSAFGFTALADTTTASMDEEWSAIAYVRMIPSDIFESGKERLTQMMIDVKQQYVGRREADIFFALKDVLFVDVQGDRSVSVAKMLTPTEAVEKADEYEPKTYALPCTRFVGKVFDEITEFAKVGKRPIWRTARSWVNDMFTLRDNRQAFDLEVGALSESGVIDQAKKELASEIGRYSQRLEEEYVQSKRVRFSGAYLMMCNHCIQRKIPILGGQSAATGAILAVLLLREAAFVRDYVNRARKAANALLEAVQLFSVFSPPSIEKTGEDWYQTVVEEIAQLQDVESVASTQERLSMQLDETETEEESTWEWLLTFMNTLFDSVVKNGSIREPFNTQSSTRKDEYYSYIKLDKILDGSLNDAARGNANDEARIPDLVRLVEYVGLDLLKSVTRKFEPVLFLSLCHPYIVLGELAVPSLAGPKFDDDDYTPTSFFPIAQIDESSPERQTDQSAQVLELSTVKAGDYVADMASHIIAFIHKWMVDHGADASIGAVRERGFKGEQRSKGMNGYVEAKKKEGGPNRDWHTTLYEAIFEVAYDADTEGEDTNMKRMFFVYMLRFMFDFTRGDPQNPETTGSKRRQWEARASLTAGGVKKVLAALEAYKAGVKDKDGNVLEDQRATILRFFSFLKPTRELKMEGGGYGQYVKGKKKDAAVERMDEDARQMFNVLADDPDKLFNEFSQAGRLKNIKSEQENVGVNTLDVLVDMLGMLRALAVNDPNHPHSTLYNDVIESVNFPGSNVALMLEYFDMRWSDQRDAFMAYIKRPLLPSSSSPAAGPSSSAAPEGDQLTAPPPPPPQLPVVSSVAPSPQPVTRRELLSLHNMFDRMAHEFATSDISASPSHQLPEHDLSPRDGDNPQKATLASDVQSTLIHRTASRRAQIESSRKELNGHRAFNWMAPDAEHLREILDDRDRWASYYSTTKRSGKAKNIFTHGLSGRVRNEILLPVAPDLPQLSIDDVKDPTGVENIRRDLRRWSWLLEFDHHDALLFKDKKKTIDDILDVLSPARSSRRVLAQSDSAHMSMSVLARTGVETTFENVYVNGVPKIEELKFNTEQLLALVGANTVSDRLFVCQGFLDKSELLAVYQETVKDHGGDTWLSDASLLVEGAEPTNEAMTSLRMGDMHKNRFLKLRDAFKALSQIRSATGLLTSMPQDPLNSYLRAVNADAETSVSDLKAHQHIRFGDSTKCKFGNSTAGRHAFAETLSTEFRFLHFYDLNESMMDKQRFCPYKLDDLSSHAVDVAERIHCIQELLLSEKQIEGQGGNSFTSLQSNIDGCELIMRQIGPLRAWCASVKMMLLSIVSKRFDAAHQSSTSTKRAGHWGWLASDAYNHLTDDTISHEKRPMIESALATIQDRMEAYDRLAEQTLKLKIEAAFLKRAGDRMYKKACTDTSQRVVTNDLTVAYIGFNAAEFSQENFPLSEQSYQMPIVSDKARASMREPSSRILKSGWGSMYTVGGNITVIDAFRGRGNLYQDARYTDDTLSNSTFLKWCATGAIKDCNTDFGVYGLYADYIGAMADRKVYDMEDDYPVDDDDSDMITVYNNNAFSRKGTAFQHWASTELYVDGETRRKWRSVERLPTYAELMCELSHEGPKSNCFDGLETPYLPDMESYRDEFNRMLGVVSIAEMVAFRRSPLDRALLAKPLLMTVFSEKKEIDFSEDIKFKSSLLDADQKSMVKELARLLTGISGNEWKSWKQINQATEFKTNRNLSTTSGQTWQDLKCSLEPDTDDEDDFAAGDCAGREYRDNPDDPDDPDDADPGGADEGDADPDDPDDGDADRDGAQYRPDVEGMAGQAAAARYESTSNQNREDARRQRENRRTALEESMSQARRAEEEARRTREALARRDLAVSCPAIVQRADYEVLRTVVQGDCFYDSVARIRQKEGGNVDKEDLRRDASNFFAGQFPYGLEGADYDRLSSVRDILITSIRETIQSAATADDISQTALYEVVRDNSWIGGIAETGTDDELATAYSQIIAISGDNTPGREAAWANAPEINAVGHLIKRRICVYRQSGQWQITLSRGMGEYGYTGGPPLAILWTNPLNPLRSHFMGLRIFQPVPTPMSLGAALAPSINWTDVVGTEESHESVMHAVAAFSRLSGHRRILDVDALASTVAAIEKLGSKHSASASLGHPSPKGIAAIPFAAKTNLAIYEQLSSVNNETFFLVEAHRPLSCAYDLRLIRRVSDEGGQVYTIA